MHAVPLAGSPQDGYDWRGPVKRSSVPIARTTAATNLEVTQFFGGTWDADPALMVVRIEYRILIPNNRVYLVHYLLLDGTGTTVVPPDLQIPAGTVNPASIFSGGPSSMPTERSVDAQRPVVALPKAVVKPAPVLPQAQPVPLKKQHVKASAGAQHEDGSAASFLAIDDDSVTRVDTAYARYKFVASVLDRLFAPPERKEGNTPKPPCDGASEDELAELLEMQAALLGKELEQSQAIASHLRAQEQDRRALLNELFSTMLEASSPDEALSQWEAASGYSLAELRPEVSY